MTPHFPGWIFSTVPSATGPPERCSVAAFIDFMLENTPSGWPNYAVKKPK